MNRTTTFTWIPGPLRKPCGPNDPRVTYGGFVVPESAYASVNAWRKRKRFRLAGK